MKAQVALLVTASLDKPHWSLSFVTGKQHDEDDKYVLMRVDSQTVTSRHKMATVEHER